MSTGRHFRCRRSARRRASRVFDLIDRRVRQRPSARGQADVVAEPGHASPAPAPVQGVRAGRFAEQPSGWRSAPWRALSVAAATGRAFPANALALRWAARWRSPAMRAWPPPPRCATGCSTVWRGPCSRRRDLRAGASNSAGVRAPAPPQPLSAPAPIEAQRQHRSSRAIGRPRRRRRRPCSLQLPRRGRRRGLCCASRCLRPGRPAAESPARGLYRKARMFLDRFGPTRSARSTMNMSVSRSAGSTGASSSVPSPSAAEWISSRRPPTFMPATPCSQPGMTWPLPSVNGNGSARFHEASKTFPALYSAPT